MNDAVNKLISALREDAGWAEANEWETPITLSDHLNDAADLIEALSAKLEQVKRERDAIVKMFRDRCEYCKHFYVTHNGCTPDCDCDEIECKYVDGHWTGWQWCGVKGE